MVESLWLLTTKPRRPGVEVALPTKQIAAGAPTRREARPRAGPKTRIRSMTMTVPAQIAFVRLLIAGPNFSDGTGAVAGTNSAVPHSTQQVTSSWFSRPQ